MKTPLAAWIARRYLFSRKSHGAVSAIAWVSVAGVAIATAAIVCVLSVFNGFRYVLGSKLDTLTADVVVCPVRGKTIANGDSLAAVLAREEGVAMAMPVVCDQALAIAGTQEMPVTLKGVDPATYRRLVALDTVLIAGDSRLADAEALPQTVEDVYGYEEQVWLPARGVASVGVAARLGSPRPGDRLLLFAPRRKGRVNMANPMSSFVTDSLTMFGVFETQQSDFDQNMLIVPIEVARNLFQYDAQATAVELKARHGTDPARLAASLSRRLGPGYEVRDRLRQQEVNFRMVAIEKWVTYLLLFFILVIASFNIVSTMSMFVLEKRRQMTTLVALGMTRRRVGRVFSWESMMVTLAGAAIGLLLGLGLCLLQEHYGLLRIGADSSRLIMAAYPVRVVWTDLIAVAVPVLLIGAATAAIASAFARQRLKSISN